ncbi:hypothetical protein ABZX95_00615 [Streptomyces sp. NPDC004232]|uniref:hypothetical protein n=1 Tax=unclassified Streptomyces TaxID=2593676 RepID=UPI001DD8D536|nr:hypothetical protein [Streptomyces sp. tea 10]
MTRIAKIVATTALLLGATVAAASPALADNHQPVSPDNTHATIVSPDNIHITGNVS